MSLAVRPFSIPVFTPPPFRHTAVACLALALAMPAPARALDPKDAWDLLDGFVTGLGGGLTSSGLLREGQAIVASDVVLRLSERLQMVMDDLRLEPRGGQVALIPSASFMANADWGATGDWRDFVIDHDGALLLSATQDSVALGLGFETLSIARSDLAPEGGGTPDDFAMRLTGLTGQIDTRVGEAIDMTANLLAEGLDYTLAVTDAALGLAQTSRTRSRDLRWDMAVTGFRDFDPAPGWVARAFDEGFSLTATLVDGGTEADLTQTMMGTPTAAQMRSEGSDAQVTLAEGALQIATNIQGLALDVQTMGLPISGRLGRMGLEMELPVIATPDIRPFRFALDFEALTLAESLLAMIGAGDFADDPLSAALDIQAEGRWLIEITDDPEPTEMPIDVAALVLNRLALAIGDSALGGDGRLALAPGALAQAGDGIPEGEGDFAFDLRGGEALLGRLAAAGLIPPDQQFVARMVMSALGRSVGEDHLRSEVAIRPGGELTVNGMPLPF